MSKLETWVGRFGWHGLFSPDTGQLQGFYKQLFGWETEPLEAGGTDYAMISAGGQAHGALGKAFKGAPSAQWLGHVRTEDVDEATLKVEGAGGKLEAGPLEMSGVGRVAIISDPQGVFIGLHQPQGRGAIPEGIFVWDELGTTDVDGAQRFYEEVFGWTTRDMGADFGGYRIFSRGETDVGGLMSLPDASAPAGWQPYIAVEDPDQTTATAKELGASVVLEPNDVKQVGRLAILRDPQGAVFGIIRPEPAP